ncbi:hypothetical protein BJ322DRAFT_1019300 [Thelephora terrestris]|uniref:Uncharacterized protein n=1 Tax=Thelephora terrestris TaxID=56493 RepID=A0A9P6L7F9_9AGAM|nr:hypothetical protein BJ322DRAFT_1019300 [Thelephora terrestris]
MGLRDSISRLKEKAKARLSRSRPEQERNEAGNGRAVPTNPRRQPKPQLRVIEDSGNVDPRVGGSDDNTTKSNRGSVPPSKYQRHATNDSREDWKSTVSKPGRTEVGTRGAGPTNPHRRPEPRIGVEVGGGDVNPRVGGSSENFTNPDRGGMSRRKNQQNAANHSRGELKESESKPERSAIGTKRVGPTSSYRQPKPRTGELGGENVNPRVEKSENDTIKPDRGGVPHGKNQKNTGSDSREHREPNVSKPERSAAGTRRDGPNYSLRRPKPLLGTVGDSEDANLRVGGSSGT